MKKSLLLFAFFAFGTIAMLAQLAPNIYLKTQSAPYSYSIHTNRNVKLCLVNEHGDVAFDLLSYILRYTDQELYDYKLNFCYVDLSQYLSLTERYRVEYQFNGFFSYKLRYNEPTFHINAVEVRDNHFLGRILDLSPDVTEHPTYILHTLNQSSGYTDYFTFEELGCISIDYLGFEICLY